MHITVLLLENKDRSIILKAENDTYQIGTNNTNYCSFITINYGTQKTVD